jgi:chloramphenicol-sensitive protein RarD
MNKRIWYAIGAYAIWGLFPIYWKWLRDVSALQLLSHRFVWSFLMLSAVIILARQWTNFAAAVRAPRVVGVYFAAAVLIAVNWLVYK